MKPILPYIYNKISSGWYRLRLRNDNFTILTNSCIGGIMYHKLGKQFMSPTINLWMHDEEFYRFVNNLDYYFAQPLRFEQNDLGYPTAYCGDILIHFNHYKTLEEAELKWNERKARINRDNLFIICSDRPYKRKITHEDMLSLKNVRCRGKVIFSVRQYDDIDYIVPLPKDDEGDFVKVYMFDKTKYFKCWRWEKAWDWVHWLNTGEVKVK
ncbi:MAG: DUF1919 domain-containing protein [Paludibacteraceae bacterium]|nr:DUF1919 domain-containing protein [Paludibacteraceae bacterium]